MPVDDDGWDYDPASDGDGSGQCFLTANSAGNSDVDNGLVRLISPVFDLSGGGDIEYDYYLYLTDVTGGYDKLLVEINNNSGTGSWVEIARHDVSSGENWSHHLISETEILAAGVVFSDSMQVRFFC